MASRRQGALIAFAAAGAVVAMAVTTAASAAPKVLLKGALYGNIPDVTVRGVAAGKLPWVVQGSVELTTDHLTASGKELLVPEGPGLNGAPVPAAVVGTTVGVKAVVAEVSCAGRAAVVTKAVPLSATGSFAFDTPVTLPAQCLDPIVLVGPGVSGKKMVAWFASTDFLTDYGVATPAVLKAPTKAVAKAPAKGKTPAKTSKTSTTSKTAKTSKTSTAAKGSTTSKATATATTTTTTTSTGTSTWA
jgi:hypothetical protein